MKWIDRFFNTYSKRIVVLLGLILIFIIMDEINNFQLGIFLSKIETIDDIYHLIQYSIVYKTFIGSLLVNYLDTYGSFFYVLIKSIDVWQFGLILISGLIIFSDHDDHFLNKIKKQYGVLIIVLILRYLLILITGIQVLNAQDTIMGISNITIVGNILKYSSLALIVGSISYLIYLTQYFVIKK